MNDFTLPGPRPSYRSSVATNDDSALEALRGWHVRLDAYLECAPSTYSWIIFQPDELADAALMRLGIKFPDVVSAIREAVKESGQSLGILKLANESEDAVEDLAEHLVFLESRVKAGIAIIEEQLAADSGGSGPPTKTSSAQPLKENERTPYLDLDVNKDKQTVQRLETGHILKLSGDEWTMFKLAFEAGSDGVTNEVWKSQHAGEWGEASRKSKSRLNDKLAALRVALAKGQDLRLIETE